MTTIGSIGIGLFILIIVWIVALIVFVIGVKFESNIAWIGLGVAALFTIILVVIPTEKKVPDEDLEEKDYSLVYKQFFLTFLVITALLGFVVFFVQHCIQPVRPKPLKGFYVQ